MRLKVVLRSVLAEFRKDIQKEFVTVRHETRKEFVTFRHDIQKDFRAFGEGLSLVRTRVERMEPVLKRVAMDVTILKVASRRQAKDIASIKRTLASHGKRLTAHGRQLTAHGKRLTAIEKNSNP